MASPVMTPPPKPHGIHTGAILLILIGVAFLLYNFGFTFPWFRLYARWWPLLLVVIGVLKLVEYYLARRSNTWAPGVGFGTVVLMIFIIITGLSASKMVGINWDEIRTEMGMDDEDFFSKFGNSYTYEDKIEQDFPANGSLKLICDRGNVNVNASTDGKLRIVVNKRVWARTQSDADKGNADTKPQVQLNGTILTVNANTSGAGNNKEAQADLDVYLPKKADLTLETRRGDVNVVSREGAVRISHQRGQANVEDVTGDVAFTCDRVSVRATRIVGNLAVQGRVEDVNVESVSGGVTLEGDHFNDVRLAKVDKTVKFKSSRTDLELASVQGDLSMAIDDLRAKTITGPVRLVTQSKEIQLADVSGDVQIENANADVQLQATRLGNYTIQNRRGDVTIVVPAKAAFSINGNARHGDVVADFRELQVENDDREGRVTGVVGKGGPQLQITTDGSDINLHRAGSAGIPLPPMPPAPAAVGRDGIIPGVWYNVINKSSGSCVDDRGYGTSNGSAVHQWDCNPEGQANQEWQFQPTDGGYYRVVSRQAPGLGWDALRWGTENGTRIHLWEYVGGTNQQWMPTPVGNGYYKFVGRASQRCLDVPGATSSNGVQLQIYDCNDSSSQAFRLVKRQ